MPWKPTSSSTIRFARDMTDLGVSAFAPVVLVSNNNPTRYLALFTTIDLTSKGIQTILDEDAFLDSKIVIIVDPIPIGVETILDPSSLYLDSKIEHKGLQPCA